MKVDVFRKGLTQKDDDGDSILEVKSNRVYTLRATDIESGMSLRTLDNGLCIVITGTLSDSPITMTYLPTSLRCHSVPALAPDQVIPGGTPIDRGEHNFETFRTLIATFVKHPDDYQRPVVWGIFDRLETGPELEYLKTMAATCLLHLQVRMNFTHSDTYGDSEEVEGKKATILSPGNYGPAIYVNGRLLCQTSEIDPSRHE